MIQIAGTTCTKWITKAIQCTQKHHNHFNHETNDPRNKQPHLSILKAS